MLILGFGSDRSVGARLDLALGFSRLAGSFVRLWMGFRSEPRNLGNGHPVLSVMTGKIACRAMTGQHMVAQFIESVWTVFLTVFPDIYLHCSNPMPFGGHRSRACKGQAMRVLDRSEGRKLLCMLTLFLNRSTHS